MRDNIAVGIVAALVVLTSLATLYAWAAMEKGEICLWSFPIAALIPTFFSLGLIAGYLLHKAIEGMQIVSNALLKGLEGDEKKVVEILLGKGGKCLQSSISRELGKVKASRVIQRLEKKGIVERVKVGKTYIVALKVE